MTEYFFSIQFFISTFSSCVSNPSKNEATIIVPTISDHICSISASGYTDIQEQTKQSI